MYETGDQSTSESDNENTSQSTQQDNAATTRLQQAIGTIAEAAVTGIQQGWTQNANSTNSSAAPAVQSTRQDSPQSDQAAFNEIVGNTVSHVFGQAPASGSTAGVSIKDIKGEVLTSVNVYLLFWGTAWTQNPTPSTDDITNSIRSMLAGDYMSALAQYRNVGRGSLYGSAQVAADPPNPCDQMDVNNLVKDPVVLKDFFTVLTGAPVPGPDDVEQLLYCVVLPAGVSLNMQGAKGFHLYVSAHDIDTKNAIRYACITNDGTLDSVTTIFSHELVEACTNPDGDGFQLDAPGLCVPEIVQWCEIADVCEGKTGNVDGVTVQAYWSAKDNACLVPGAQ